MAFWTIPLLTKAPDSQSHKLEKFSGPQGAYGENPEWEPSSRKDFAPEAQICLKFAHHNSEKLVSVGF